jgi:hypothetical protein
MPVAFLVLHALLAALAVALPLLLARRARALLVAGLALGLPAQLAVARWPSVLAVTGWSDALFVSELYLQFALWIATSAIVAQPPGRPRRRTAALALVLVVAGARATSLPLRAPPPLTGPARVKDGVVLQSAPSSCAAAAAATLLRALSIDPDATEADLARLCLTRPDRGTSDLGLFRGVARSAPGRRVRFARPGLDGLRRLGRPAIIGVGLDPARVDEPLRSVLRDECGWDEGVAHAVVLFALEGDAAVVGDPRIGRERWSLTHFVALWDGSALVID